MKKKLLYFLMLLGFAGLTNVNAKEIAADDIEPRTYIIGTHEFTENTTLSTKHIMLASKTISGSTKNDMIIYYKNPRGKWVNGITGEEIIISSKIEITHIDEENIETLQYGDVKNDGKINSKDVIILIRYLAGWEMPADANIRNADVNADGKINEADVALLRKYIANWYQDKNLPNEPLGKSYIIEYIVDDEIYNTDYELENHKVSKPTEPTKDGYAFDGWYLDADYKTKFDFENSNIAENIVLYAKFANIQYGDVKNDGKINSKDVIILIRYLAGWEMPADANIRNADVNADGKINEADVALLRKYIANWYQDKNLPNEPLGKSYIIEYIVDDEIYNTDYELENHKVSKPTEPTKDGYAFDGWYLDADYKTKFDFENSKIVENIVLYAKFTKKVLEIPTIVDSMTRGNETIISFIEKGYYAGNENTKEITGWELYEKTENGYAKIYGGATREYGVEIAKSETKTLVARVYKQETETIYSEYSEEITITGKAIGTPTLTITGTNGKEIELSIDKEGYYADANNQSEISKLEIWEVDKNEQTGTVEGTHKVDDCSSLTKCTVKVEYGNSVQYFAFVYHVESTGYEIYSEQSNIVTVETNLLGDADESGEIDITDATIIRRYAHNLKVDKINLKNADVNNDGEVNEVDANIIENYLAFKDDTEKSFTLPYDSGKTYTISYDLDGGTIEENNQITYAEISLPLTLINPTKEGYEFAGWTGSNGDTPEIEVKIPNGTAENLNYKANWTSKGE